VKAGKLSKEQAKDLLSDSNKSSLHGHLHARGQTKAEPVLGAPPTRYIYTYTKYIHT